MKTILVPIDFSETSTNALKYAADFSADIDVDRIILLKSVYVSVYAQLLPSADFVQLTATDIETERKIIKNKILDISQNFIKKCNQLIKIEIAISEEPLLRSIHELIDREKPDLLIIGNDGGMAYVDDSDIGGQVIAIAKTSAIPVMIIPAEVKYKKIEQALVPCDFETIGDLGMLEKLPGAKRWLHPRLLVLNVATKPKHQIENEVHTDALKGFLENYQYTVYCSAYNNTVKCILDFAKDHDVQLIISLPGKYSFFFSFTHKNITDALALNSTHPVLILK